MQVLAPDARLPNLRELIGIANDLEVETLLKASGLFPHSHFGRQKWLSPRERCVLFFGDFHMSMRLKRLMRQGPYAVSFDHDFEGVIKAAGPRRASCMPMPSSMTRDTRILSKFGTRRVLSSVAVMASPSGARFFTESRFWVESNTSKLRLRGFELASRPLGLSVE